MTLLGRTYQWCNEKSMGFRTDVAEGKPQFHHCGIWTGYLTHMHNSSFIKKRLQSNHSIIANSLWPHGLQHTRLPCPSPTPWACSDSCQSSQWCHPTISSSVIPFSHLQSFAASGSFPMSQFFASGGQNSGASAAASVLPVNIENRLPLGLTGLISLQTGRLSGVFSNTTVQKHQFFSTQLSL